MSEPIVLISHQRVKEGKLEDYRQSAHQVWEVLKKEKPDTVVHLGYISQDNEEVTMIHVFPDAQGMDKHFEGVNERVNRAFDYIEIIGYEIYGSPSEAAKESMQQFANSMGVEIKRMPQNMGGFLRMKAG
jgi:hypothetical protein